MEAVLFAQKFNFNPKFFTIYNKNYSMHYRRLIIIAAAQLSTYNIVLYRIFKRRMVIAIKKDAILVLKWFYKNSILVLTYYHSV